MIRSPKLREKGVIDLIQATNAHKLKYLEVLIFSRFINSEYCAEDLLFFLKARLWLLQRCVSVPITNESLGIYIIESFLTVNQVRSFFRHYFKDTDNNIVEELIRRGSDCADSNRGGPETPNIPLMRILELSVSELSDARIRDMRRILAFYRPLPRLTMKRFIISIRNIIPNLDEKVAESLFESSLAPNSVRSDAEMTEIISMFKEHKIPKCNNFAQYSIKYASVQSRFSLFMPFLTKIINMMSNKKDDVAKAMLSEIWYRVYSVFDAQYSCDANLIESCYHKLLKILFACMKNNAPDGYLFTSWVCEFEKKDRRTFEKYIMSFKSFHIFCIVEKRSPSWP